jgi:exosome complex component RRP41
MAIKRIDGRKAGELRKIEAKVGVVPNADGSAMFKIGNTHAIVVVYGPRELHPKFLQNPEKGILRCYYSMMPFSGHGERVRPGGNRRSKEISMLIEKSLLPVLNLENFPNSVVDIFIDLPQTDAGTRCAGICAASLALADAGLLMKDLVSAISMGFLDGEILVDINSNEDCDLGATDVPIAYIPVLDKISLLQLDGGVSKETLFKILEIGKENCLIIDKIQRKALKEKYVE